MATLDASAPARPATPPVIAAETRQLIVGVSNSWSSDQIEMHRFRREVGGEWVPVNTGAPWKAAIGHAGLGWGVGLHGEGPPRGHKGPLKIEGDGRSPAGVFAVGEAFGYAKSAPEGARSAYTALDRTWRCVDDPASAQYNRVFSEKGVAKDWTSAERMRRSDELYRWVVLIDHNRIATRPRTGETRGPIAGSGSCIFFHVWRTSGSPTVGCAAMDRAQIETLIEWLEPASRPVVVLLPRAQLGTLGGEWGLPRI